MRLLYRVQARGSLSTREDLRAFVRRCKKHFGRLSSCQIQSHSRAEPERSCHVKHIAYSLVPVRSPLSKPNQVSEIVASALGRRRGQNCLRLER